METESVIYHLDSIILVRFLREYLDRIIPLVSNFTGGIFNGKITSRYK